MSFTDDDLKRLKELDSAASIHDHYGNEEIRKSIPALLARLEASERLNEALGFSMTDIPSEVHIGTDVVMTGIMVRAWHEWRKEAGRE